MLNIGAPARRLRSWQGCELSSIFWSGSRNREKDVCTHGYELLVEIRIH